MREIAGALRDSRRRSDRVSTESDAMCGASFENNAADESTSGVKNTGTVADRNT